jgi:hypothetical protein
MAAMGGMGMGVPGMPGPEAVDLGGMGVPPVAMNPADMIDQAMMAVRSKWASQEAQLAGEQNSLMEILMMLAGAQPPSAAEAAVVGGDPAGYGMEPM